MTDCLLRHRFQYLSTRKMMPVKTYNQGLNRHKFFSRQAIFKEGLMMSISKLH